MDDNDTAVTTRGSPRVGILLFDEVQIIDFAAPFEVFGQARFPVATVSADGGPVTTAMGLTVSPDHGFDGAPAFDILVVPGGDVRAVAKEERVRRWLSRQAGRADCVMSVCTGAYLLGHAGLLRGLDATTYHRAFEHLAGTFPETRVVRDRRFVDSGRIVTAAGLSSGIDAALHVVARFRGPALARSIAMNMEYDWNPDDGFVRGCMADRWIDRPRIAWPADTEFRRLTAFGDDRRWEERYRVTTGASPAAVLEALRGAYAELDHWSERAARPDRLHWSRTLEEGRQAALEVRVESAADGEFELAVELELEPGG